MTSEISRTEKSLRPDESSEDTNFLSKLAPSFVALISKVLLASSSQKLNLESIYRSMEEQFLHGRGHYWGVHRAYVGDFQRENFRVFRETRRRREGCDTAESFQRQCERRRLCWEEARCPLQEPTRNQTRHVQTLNMS